MSGYLIGIDAGTSVIKSVLYDAAGTEVARAQAKTEILRPRTGWCEQDMKTLVTQIEATLAHLVALEPSACRDVVAIGVSAQGDGTWLIGKDGEPVRPALLWLDARSSPIIRRWQHDGTARELFRLTWTAPCISLQHAQLRWLQENDEQTLNDTRYVLHAGDWIFYHLTGIISSEISQVGHTYFLRETEQFSPDTLRAAGIEPWTDRIPRMRDAFAEPGHLQTEVAERTGLRPGIPIIGPLFDVCASAIGMGALEDGDVCTILGSAAIHEMTLAQPSPQPPGVGYNIVMGPKDRWIRMLSSMTGTLNLDWFLREIGVHGQTVQGPAPFDAVERVVRETPTGSGGLIYLPFIDLAGERSPFANASARAAWFGLHSQLGRHHMLRAVYEGVAYAARDCYEHMPGSFSAVRAAGGGVKSPTWVQILADVTGKTVIPFADECGARGAALMAGTVCEVYASLDEAVAVAVKPTSVVEPRPEQAEEYNEFYDMYKQLLACVLPIWEELESDDGRAAAL